MTSPPDSCLTVTLPVTYVGHKIDAEGLHPLPDKLEAIKLVPTPTNVSELKSYLGLSTFYEKYIPNMSTQLEPLYQMFAKGIKW